MIDSFCESTFFRQIQDDYEINKVLKKMLPLCFPGSFEFVYRKDGVDYPLSGNKEGSSFGSVI